MKYPTLLGAILLLALLLTACGPAATASPTATTAPTETMAPTQPPVTEEPTATEAATEAPTEAPTGVPVTGEATVMVSDVGTFGQALVDGQGRTLYLFTNDTQNSGVSACSG